MLKEQRLHKKIRNRRTIKNYLKFMFDLRFKIR